MGVAEQLVVTMGCICRVYGPKVAALGKKGKAQRGSSCLAQAKDFTCRHTLSKRQLPPGARLATWLEGVACLRATG